MSRKALSSKKRIRDMRPSCIQSGHSGHHSFSVRNAGEIARSATSWFSETALTTIGFERGVGSLRATLTKRGKAHEDPYSIVVLFAVAELHAWLFAGESGQLRDAELRSSSARC